MNLKNKIGFVLGILAFSISLTCAAGPGVINDIKLTQGPGGTQIVFDFTQHKRIHTAHDPGPGVPPHQQPLHLDVCVFSFFF